MSFQRVRSVAVLGLDVLDVDIEANIDNKGFPGFEIVGLAAREISESKERIKAAIRNSGFKFPNKKIVVNLAPADFPKKGALYDVPIAVGILAAAGLIKGELNNFIFIGELSLSGNISRVTGSTLIATESAKLQKVLVLPEQNEDDVSFIQDIKYLPFKKLKDLVDCLNSDPMGNIQKFRPRQDFSPKNFNIRVSDIKGNDFAKRALMIAVAGRHNVCLVGSPGSGKTLLARSIESLMPILNDSEFLESARISSLANIPLSDLPPFRFPNHPITNRTLIGGGQSLNFGEITLAHKGVLFIDEFTEVESKVINNLRIPLEEGQIKLTAGKHKAVLPCDFMLVLAANPCVCGNFGDTSKRCTCSQSQLARYASKLKNPLMDRIDIFLNVYSIDSEDLASGDTGLDFDVVRERIFETVQTQSKRCSNLGFQFKYNANLSPGEIVKACNLSEPAAKTVYALNKRFSSRSIHKIIKVARTISDLEKSFSIKNEHILEAIQYKNSIDY